VDREEFRPYGETSYGSYALKRYRFTGRERDEESGLSYHGARYYALGLARWISPDPAGTTDGTNLFAYSRNNPILYEDPGGRSAGTSSENNETPSSPSQLALSGAAVSDSGQKAGPDTPAEAKARVQLGNKMGKSATIMGDSGKFGGSESESPRLNPEYWDTVTKTNEKKVTYTVGFRLKQGVSASAAINDAFKNGGIIDCQIGLQLIFARAILETIGSKAFDRAFGGEGRHGSNLAVGYGDEPPPSKLRELYETRTLSDKGQLLPGDMVYFHNAGDFLEKQKATRASSPYWRGENAAFVGWENGERVFSGLDVDRHSEERINQRLYREYNRVAGDNVTYKDWRQMEARPGVLTGLSLSVLRPRIDKILALRLPPLR
jgi:RHS repeat-associated protein